MEPRIQYAKTKDGVSIAYATIGDGYPLIYMPIPIASHVQLEWESPLRSLYEHFAAKFQLVRFDPRGIGLSDRAVDDFSLEARVGDLEAVISKLGSTRFALAGHDDSGALAVAYAVRHPEKVSHLILVDAYSRSADQLEVPQIEGVMELLSRDWEMFTENIAALGFGWGREEARQMGELLRACITQEAAKKLFSATPSVDVTELLSGISAPTLVMTHAGVRGATIDLARRLASHIPQARLVVLNGTWADTAEDFVRAINEFLDEAEEATAATARQTSEHVHTILFTDMEGSTDLTQRLGDARAQNVLRTHNTIVRDALKAHNGSETKHTGDGIMASFTSASSALAAAVAIQKALADHNEGNPDAAIRVRIGLNAGEPVAEDEDLFGTAVQLAARVCDKAEPGQILVADVVQQLAAGKGFTFVDMGEASLKGFEKPVRLHEVRWHD
jgi:class 3 adenylate cyclase